MGGSGSGTWLRLGCKREQDYVTRLDISYLKKGGFLQSENLQVGCIRDHWFVVDITDLPYCRILYDDKAHHIHLLATYPHYGGIRWWFECPKCYERKGVLYLHQYSVACRTCHNLTYECQNEADDLRGIRRAVKHNQKIGSTRGLCGIPDKPKHMHWETYWRHAGQVAKFINQFAEVY